MRRKILAWLPPILWMVFIFLLSSQSQIPQLMDPLLQTLLSKGIHLLEYAILFLLLYRAQKLEGKPLQGGNALLSLFIATLYGASDEFHQSFVPTRHPSALDVGIDALGAAIALLGMVLLSSRARRSAGRDGFHLLHGRQPRP